MISHTDFLKAEDKREGRDTDELTQKRHSGSWSTNITSISVENTRQLVSNRPSSALSLLMFSPLQRGHELNRGQEHLDTRDTGEEANADEPNRPEEPEEPDSARDTTSSVGVGSKRAH